MWRPLDNHLVSFIWGFGTGFGQSSTSFSRLSRILGILAKLSSQEVFKILPAKSLETDSLYSLAIPKCFPMHIHVTVASFGFLITVCLRSMYQMKLLYDVNWYLKESEGYLSTVPIFFSFSCKPCHQQQQQTQESLVCPEDQAVGKDTCKLLGSPCQYRRHPSPSRVMDKTQCWVKQHAHGDRETARQVSVTRKF